ncbi:hypothetical protein PCL_04769 [Purpureocillium lilacinum]|uniref:Uncharacterized protein n=1 Tax=Purpureocillium lilacinum TaxID=33203 RepID=A0A2U3DWJ0_PURLI|nr:hypothetical protein PCL_04769 [Purpureocillium lilacinum]
MLDSIAPLSKSFASYFESVAEHTRLVLVDEGLAIGGGVLGRGEEHALVAPRLLVLAHAAGLWLGRSSAAKLGTCRAAICRAPGDGRSSCGGFWFGLLTLGLEAEASVAAAAGAAAWAVAAKRFGQTPGLLCGRRGIGGQTYGAWRFWRPWRSAVSGQRMRVSMEDESRKVGCRSFFARMGDGDVADWGCISKLACPITQQRPCRQPGTSSLDPRAVAGLAFSPWTEKCSNGLSVDQSVNLATKYLSSRCPAADGLDTLTTSRLAQRPIRFAPSHPPSSDGLRPIPPGPSPMEHPATIGGRGLMRLYSRTCRRPPSAPPRRIPSEHPQDPHVRLSTEGSTKARSHPRSDEPQG